MQNAKILVVDDDADFIFSTRTVLEQNGYEVISAGNGNHGRATLAREKPDLVILDVIMSSVLDGLNMSRFMRDDPVYKDIPIIMVTSIANTDYQALFPADEDIDIDAFLTKPIKPTVLTEKVKELLYKKGGMK
ncbi:response regulator [Sphingomonas sp. UBA4815]|jgi:CheY-like chemotaxis protein|uniref:response regulator n=1 Tax=Sphingomonas sp. UBA4815 TaxID=1947533 RepID=UPI0031F4AD40